MAREQAKDGYLTRCILFLYVVLRESMIMLNALFHLDSSPGNLSWEQYELIKNTPGVKEAYPIAVGDNYLGYRLVGTDPQLFYRHEWKKGEKYK